MGSGRMRRVDAAIREVLGEALLGLSDPRIGFTTVTAVTTSPDLRQARVHVSVLGDEDARRDSLDGLHAAHGVLQRQLARELTLKHTPTLAFVHDDTTERSIRIGALIAEGERERPA